jgi:hypothetical protein
MSTTDTDFNFGDEIQTFNYKKLVKIKPYQGRKRIVEETDEEDSYTDSLEEEDSQHDLEYVFSDVDDNNENTITQKEKYWYEGWNKHYIWDEDKKEYNLGGRKAPKEFVCYSNEQIQRTERRKKREHNLKKKHLIAIYMNFDPDEFDINEDYEKDCTKTYNKYKVKLKYETKKRIIIKYHLLHL